LLIDGDAQAHATVAAGLKPQGNFYDLLVRGAEWQDTLRVSPLANTLWVLGGNVETSNIANSIDNHMSLHERLDELSEGVDYVVIDTSPTPSLLHSVIYLASDEIICPTQTEHFSLSGLNSTLMHYKRFDAQRRGVLGKSLVPIGIIPTMVTSSKQHQANLTSLKQKFGDLVWESVSRKIAWLEAGAQNKLVWDYSPETAAATEGLSVVQKVLDYE